MCLWFIFLYVVPNVCSQVHVPILLPGFELSSFQITGGRFPCPDVRQPATFVQPFCCSHEPLGSALSQVALRGFCFQYWKPPSAILLFCVHSQCSSLCSFCFTEKQDIDCTDTLFFLGVSVHVCMYWALSGSGSVPIRAEVVAGASIQFMCECLCSHYCTALLWTFPM